MSPLQTSMRRFGPRKGVKLSAILRGASLSVASMATVAMVFAIGPAPTASATPCGAPEANVEPPPRQEIPAPQPVVQPPTGRRPTHTNDSAPLPKLGPLISSFLKPTVPGQKYSAPLVPQAGVVPPQPTPPAPGLPQPPNAPPLQRNAAAVPPQPAPHPEPAPGPPPASIAGAPTSLVDWVTG